MKKIIISTLVSAVILFLWSGITQMLPWGITSTQNISTQANNQVDAPNLIELSPGSLTTDQFETQFLGKISTLSTDHTFSWIITQPLQTDYTGYFIKEFITQLSVGILLALLLYITLPLTLKIRIQIVLLAGFGAAIASYGQLMNWWALPAGYGLGVSLNLIIGWTLAAFVSARFIIPSINKSNYELQ